MIDFENADYIKLRGMDDDEAIKSIADLIIPGEEVIAGFKTVRDKVVFTSKRIITINVQGITGKKVDYTSIPYARIQTYSVETSGRFDIDCEIQVWVSTVGVVRFEIMGGFDVRKLNKAMSECIL